MANGGGTKGYWAERDKVISNFANAAMLENKSLNL